MLTYEDVKPFWEAWKFNNGEPCGNPEAADKMRKMDEALRSVAGVMSPTTENATVVEYIRQEFPLWKDQIRSHPNWSSEAGTLRVYRGLRDEKAIGLRLQLKQQGAYNVESSIPLCYSTSREVAKGFAHKGLIERTRLELREKDLLGS